MKELTQLQQFALEHRTYWWWVKDVTELSEESIVEGVLSYGDMETKKGLLHMLGKRKFTSLFDSLSKGRRAQNLEPRTIAYWSRYLKK